MQVKHGTGEESVVDRAYGQLMSNVCVWDISVRWS